MNDWSEVIIVGSGPAAVCAAWPLVTAGVRVLMLDQGRKNPPPDNPGKNCLEFRRNHSDPWKRFIGEDFFGLQEMQNETPKMKVPIFRHVRAGFSEALHICAKGITPTGSLAQGGLSVMWGAGAYGLTETDTKGWPIPYEQLSRSFKTVAERIGISGVDSDDLAPYLGDIPMQPPLALHDNARLLLEHYHKRGGAKMDQGFLLGRARNAVLTQPMGNRSACELDNLCLWGCGRQAIYSSDQELPVLQKQNNFRFETGAFVKQIQKGENGGYLLHCEDLDGHLAPRVFRSPVVLLGAGTLSSTALVLEHLGCFETQVPLLCHPAMALVYTLPSRWGSAWCGPGFGLGHLSYLLEDSVLGDDYVFGVLFSLEGLLASDLIRPMPVTRPTSVRLAKLLIPSLVALNCYFPGRFGTSTLNLSKRGGENVLHLEGGCTPELTTCRNVVRKRITRIFNGLGAYLVPKGCREANLGSDGHFSGTLPMTHRPGILETTSEGEVVAARNLFVVDGSVLPNLSAKHPTFAIMANADRIGTILAERLPK